MLQKLSAPARGWIAYDEAQDFRKISTLVYPSNPHSIMFATISLRHLSTLLASLLCASLPLHAACESYVVDLTHKYLHTVRLPLRNMPKKKNDLERIAGSAEEKRRSVTAHYMLGDICMQREEKAKARKHHEVAWNLLKESLRSGEQSNIHEVHHYEDEIVVHYGRKPIGSRDHWICYGMIDPRAWNTERCVAAVLAIWNMGMLVYCCANLTAKSQAGV